MAFDSFVIFTGGPKPIVGESQDSVFKPLKAMEISEFSFGAENTVSIGSATGGAGAGKATFKEFKVKKLIDTASPLLLQCLGVGAHYDKLQLYLRKAGAGAGAGQSGKSYLAFAFGMVFVKSIDWSGSSGDDTPTEEVVFEYGELFVGYSPQGKDGSLGAQVTGSWNRMTNNASTPDVTVSDVASK